MRSRLPVLVAVAIAAFSSASCAHRMSSRAVELHRVVFATPNPGHPQTRAEVEAEIELARAYAKGQGIKRDAAFGCGLAQSAVAATEYMFQEDAQLRVRTQRTLDDVCANVADRAAAERLTACPVFGVKAQTLDVGGGAQLTLSRTGVRLTNAGGVHDDLWIADCGEIIVSPRIARATAPPGSPYVPTFLEFFLWRQMLLADGTPAPGRRLEWKVMEIVPWGLPQADGAVLRNYPGESIWPIRPVPRAIARGASLRLLPSGAVRWHFEGARQFGAGTVGTLGGPPPPSGHVAGVVRDASGSVLPGVTVLLTGPDTAATAMTDPNGRFEIEAFLATSHVYTLTTALPGFETTRRQVEIAAGSTTPIDIVLGLACVEVDLVVQRGFVAEARDADLLAHIRIDSVGPAREWRLERGCVIATEVEASLLADSLGGKPRQLRLLVPSRTPSRYKQGQERVAALHWDAKAERYTHWTTGALVVKGVATLDDQSVSEGFSRETPVGPLLARLRRGTL